MPVIKGLNGLPAVISVDTRKASVARAAAKAGAKILNDVSALTYDPQSLQAAAETGLERRPHACARRAQDHAGQSALRRRGARSVRLSRGAHRRGAWQPASSRSRIAADPGLGFGKTLAHNLALLAHTSLFHGLGVPLLIGASRKRFIQGLVGGPEPQAREPGSQAAAIVAAAQGAQILRVHDVAGTARRSAVWRASVFRH